MCPTMAMNMADSFIDDSVMSQCQKVWHTGGLFLPSAGAFSWVYGTLCGVFIPTPLSPLQSPPLLESLDCPKPLTLTHTLYLQVKTSILTTSADSMSFLLVPKASNPFYPVTP